LLHQTLRAGINWALSIFGIVAYERSLLAGVYVG